MVKEYLDNEENRQKFFLLRIFSYWKPILAIVLIYMVVSFLLPRDTIHTDNQYLLHKQSPVPGSQEVTSQVIKNLNASSSAELTPSPTASPDSVKKPVPSAKKTPLYVPPDVIKNLNSHP